MNILRDIAKKLPNEYRKILKSIYYTNKIHRNKFISEEFEFSKMANWVSAGDWVLDIGANVGHYTRKFSELVKDGRVLAFEPITETFAQLALNVSDLSNVSLFNVALSDSFKEVRFSIPGTNFYMAHIDDEGPLKALAISLEAIEITNRISFIKIDAEGHEMVIIESLSHLINRDNPTLMVECNDGPLVEWAKLNDYKFADLPNSHNHILIPKKNSQDK